MGIAGLEGLRTYVLRPHEPPSSPSRLTLYTAAPPKGQMGLSKKEGVPFLGAPIIRGIIYRGLY